MSFLCFVFWNLTSDLALKLTIKFSQSLALNQVSANQTLTIADKRWNQRKWLSETKNVVNETRQTKQKHTQKTETCRQRLRWIYSSSPLDQVGQDSQQGCHLCGRRRLEMRGDHWELEQVNSSYLVLNSDLFFCSNLLKKYWAVLVGTWWYWSVEGGTEWYMVRLGQYEVWVSMSHAIWRRKINGDTNRPTNRANIVQFSFSSVEKLKTEVCNFFTLSCERRYVKDTHQTMKANSAIIWGKKWHFLIQISFKLNTLMFN